jgi:hypothetical protein
MVIGVVMETERYAGFGWIRVKRYVMDESLTWEERYRQLEKHHVQETQFLIDEVRKLATMIDFGSGSI